MSGTSPALAERVLVIDDEPDLCRLLVYNLQEMGFATETAETGLGGLDTAKRIRPVVVVLDLMLPDISGTDVCRRLRSDPELSDVGILILTARGDTYDRVVGLELGTDDYVVKPYDVREVCLRVRALARRIGERRAATGASALLRWRGLVMDVRRHQLTLDGRALELRPMEFKLLSTLLERPGQVLSREQLLSSVWDDAEEISPRNVDVQVRRLRSRLGSYADAIETVPGFGYRLREK